MTDQDPKRRAAERAHDQMEKFVLQTNEAAIQTGQAALRMITVINGGAAAAVLAFLGALAGKDKVTAAHLAMVAGSLVWFAFGVALSTLALGAGYLTNYCTANASGSREPKWEHPYFQPGRWTAAWQLGAVVFSIISILGGFAAIILFIVGIYDVRNAISQLKL